MTKFPPFNPKADWYFPLGALDYAQEIQEDYPEEAELLGVITILWNRQEEGLRRLFLALIASKRPAFAEAVWDRQPTHQARRDLLALALHTAKLTKQQERVLNWVIENTKTIADRRNELIHAEYVVHGRTYRLHAKVKAPRSNKPAKHQNAGASDLRVVVRQLEYLVQATESAWAKFSPRSLNRIRKQMAAFAEAMRDAQSPPQSLQTDCPPPSPPRKRRAKPRGPLPSSEG